MSWSEESRFTLFQSERNIRLRTEMNEVTHPSCLMCKPVGAALLSAVASVGPDLTPTGNLWDVLEKMVRSGPALQLSIQELGGRFMQLWLEINCEIAQVY